MMLSHGQFVLLGIKEIKNKKNIGAEIPLLSKLFVRTNWRSYNLKVYYAHY
jgi:hypothetical protein